MRSEIVRRSPTEGRAILRPTHRRQAATAARSPRRSPRCCVSGCRTSVHEAAIKATDHHAEQGEEPTARPHGRMQRARRPADSGSRPGRRQPPAAPPRRGHRAAADKAAVITVAESAGTARLLRRRAGLCRGTRRLGGAQRRRRFTQPIAKADTARRVSADTRATPVRSPRHIVVIDKVVAVVGNRPVLASQVEEEIFSRQSQGEQAAHRSRRAHGAAGAGRTVDRGRGAAGPAGPARYHHQGDRPGDRRRRRSAGPEGPQQLHLGGGLSHRAQEGRVPDAGGVPAVAHRSAAACRVPEPAHRQAAERRKLKPVPPTERR